MLLLSTSFRFVSSSLLLNSRRFKALLIAFEKSQVMRISDLLFLFLVLFNLFGRKSISLPTIYALMVCRSASLLSDGNITEKIILDCIIV